MDLKNVLNDEVSENKKENKKENEINNDVRIHKKPIQLRDIENRSSNNHEKIKNKITEKNMEEILNNEKNNLYFKSWNKLEIGHKLNCLQKFIIDEKNKHTLTENSTKKLELLLTQALHNNKLNKISDVKYDTKKGKIVEIKNLIYNNETKKYVLKLKETKPKTNTKSKTNIERIIQRKK